LADRRNGKPTKKWAILEQLCENYGELPWGGTPKEFDAFKRQVSELRQLLQHAFGIHADPFAECSRSGGLRAAFQAFPDAPDTSNPFA
ncbi:MAG: hypothetical protein MJE77_36015, partial [Proteobacteria bacterium]|nr:hypothetical protein [Pseudomonadota bacterium]